MALETNKFNVARKKRLEKQQFGVECNVSTEIEIDKILSVCHSAQVENVEILNGTVNYNGTIEVCLLYSTPDGEVGTINSSCPFSSKFDDKDIKVGQKAHIKVDVEECKIENVTASNIKLDCVCVQSGTIVFSGEVTKIEPGEGVCTKRDEMLVDVLIGDASETFVVESQLSIREPVKKVLFSDSQVAIKNVECGTNFVAVDGEVVSRILYLTEKDRFETAYVTESFKEEIELEGTTRDAVCEAYACIKKNMVKCEIDSQEKGLDIKLSIPVVVKVFAYEEKTESVVKDLYSTKYELEVSTESFEMTKQLVSESFESKIDGSFVLDATQPRVDKVMFVGGANLSVTNAYLKDGEVFAEGVTKTNVIYLNDETNSLHSVIIELPFVVSDKADIECTNTEVEVDVAICDVDVVVKKGREFYFDAKLKINAQYYCSQIGAVISYAQQSAQYQESDCAIQLVFASEGQSAWDVAKMIRVEEEVIYLQNPEVVFPLEKDTNLIVYYQKRN
ncbi:MAG: DUF3794 domain-containing protein [Clostridia bacterium]|nr:DUF3794 domain-containing protein [Clostridia bacterium]